MVCGIVSPRIVWPRFTMRLALRRNWAIQVRKCFIQLTANWCCRKKPNGIGRLLLQTLMRRQLPSPISAEPVKDDHAEQETKIRLPGCRRAWLSATLDLESRKR